MHISVGGEGRTDDAANGVTHNASGLVKGLQSRSDEPRLGSMSTQDETGARPNPESKPGDVDVAPEEVDR